MGGGGGGGGWEEGEWCTQRPWRQVLTDRPTTDKEPTALLLLLIVYNDEQPQMWSNAFHNIRPLLRRRYSTRPSPHARWYRDTLPPMIPIALLGSAVYMALHLVQAQLAQQKETQLALSHIASLEDELEEQLRVRDRSHAKPYKS